MEPGGFQDVSRILGVGVYLLVHRGTIVYVGKSKSLYQRIYAHRNLWNQGKRGRPQPSWMPPSAKGMLFDGVFIRPCTLEEVDALEVRMIELYRPKHNIVNQPRTAMPVELKLLVNGNAVTLSAHTKPRFERRV